MEIRTMMREIDQKKDRKELTGVMGMLYILISLELKWMYTFIKIHCTVHLKYFKAYKLLLIITAK